MAPPTPSPTPNVSPRSAMNLYIAGLYVSHFSKTGNLYRKCPPNARALRDNCRLKLESYHYIYKGRFVERIRRDNETIFLDSGAFSSFSLGVEVDIDKYAQFILDHQDIIEMASVLDAIGDPHGTWENQKYLEKKGCNVLPCFHYGEPFELAEHYAKNYPYMTIGGMVPIPNQKLEPWLDYLWANHLTDKDGKTLNKVHGFGLTARKLMRKYPWYSVDSSSWVQAASNGSIVLPEFDKAIAVSERSPQRKVFGQHFDSFPKASQDYIEALLEYYGLSYEMVSTMYEPRWALNAFTYDRVGAILGDDHWQKPFVPAHNFLF